MGWQASYCSPNCTGPACFKTELEAVNYQQPPYAVEYPELIDIYQDHPCVPVDNVIEDNIYCHNQVNSSVFLNQPMEKIIAWMSSASNNVEDCERALKATINTGTIEDIW